MKENKKHKLVFKFMINFQDEGETTDRGGPERADIQALLAQVVGTPLLHIYGSFIGGVYDSCMIRDLLYRTQDAP